MEGGGVAEKISWQFVLAVMACALAVSVGVKKTISTKYVK